MAWIRGENGLVLEVYEPISEVFAQRLARGEITQVANAAGDPLEEPVEEPTDPAPDHAAELAAVRAELAAEREVSARRGAELAAALERVAELEAATTEPKPARTRAKS